MSLLSRVRIALRPETVYAHCDIPCGIYDPHEAQVAAHTVVRMMDLISELPTKSGITEADRQALMTRYVATKETHAERVKHEVRIIWGDFFKEDHLKAAPDLHATVWKIMKLGSQARQTTDKKVADSLLAEVNKFAEMFWKAKEKPTQTAKAAYPTGKELVLPKL